MKAKLHTCQLRKTISTALLILLSFFALPAYATIYYVDYAGGSNDADGKSPQSAWKHSPGDEAATGQPASTKLAPGDTVIFKGGVAYFGSLKLANSGQAGNPITYDGNTAGTFGTGRAILDGGQVISDWKPVSSAEEVKGSPLWQQIFYADIDVDVTSNTRHDKIVLHRQVSPNDAAPWQRIMLSDGDRQILPIAQHPKPKDSFFPDLPRDFFESPNKLEVDQEKGVTTLTDPERLTSKDPRAYEGVMLGIHGGNNHVYFADIKGFDPDRHQLSFPLFKSKIYDQTQYAFYNSPAFIENPGEWSINPLGNGKSRIHLLPLHLENGQPSNVAYPVYDTGISIVRGASHLRLQGFFVQRFSGGRGGFDVAKNEPRSKDIHITNNEIRFISGHAGIGLNHADDMVVENNMIRHCPGWTSGIFVSRVTGFKINNNFLDKNSGSGIRFYEGLNGSVSGNVVLQHYGMHSSGMNLYEGCTDVVVESNFIENIITINRNAERLILRNNVIDAQDRNPVTLSIWNSGRNRGTAARDIQILNNTFVNTNTSQNWASGVFSQPGKGVSTPEGIIVRGNVMDRPHGSFKGTFENNVYTREAPAQYMGEGCQVVADAKTLFMDPENRDFRRRPGGPLPESGANLAPPSSQK